jgi:quercetin dioxygenase-like cupin family protein
MVADDPARAHNRTIEEIRTRGAIFNINEGIEVADGQKCRTRLVGWPGNGTRMVSFHLLTHEPAGGYEMHRHPISEESLVCIRGRGEINFGNGWVEVGPGNALFVPSGLTHATRCLAGSKEEFIVLSYNCPPPMEYYQTIGFFRNGNFDMGTIDTAALLSRRGNVPAECVMSLNDLGGHERGEIKGREAVAKTGGVFNLYRGATYTGNGSLMRFILWPGTGTKMVGQHIAFHDPGSSFRPHYHPISEDAIIAVDGQGQGYLESRWIDVEIGDIIYGPCGVKHGTACRSGSKPFLSTGCACPPQFDLYEHAGYLKDGVFVDFEYK